jgi:rubredoxin
MKCGFCGAEFDESEGKKGCGSCPGGCASIHCPHCNYKNPVETALIKKIRTLLNRKNKE